MKYLLFFLILTFISCSNHRKIDGETKMDLEIKMGVHKTVSMMWNNYVESNPKSKNEEMPASDFFHENKEDADRLAELVLRGKKKASSGLYSLYTHYHMPIPKIGSKQILTDFDGKAQAILKNISVDVIPFNKVSKEYATLDMGTDIEPLKKWKKAHWNFFENTMKINGQKPTEEMLIVCVKFEVIWIKKHD